MATHRVLCGGASDPAAPQPAEGDIHLDARLHSDSRNLHIDIADISAGIWRNVSDLGADLLDIAGYVYVTDTSVSRGGPTEVGLEKHSREFRLVTPVRCMEVFSRAEVVAALQKTVSLVSGDHYEFVFVDGPQPQQTRVLDFEESPFQPTEPDRVCLFSGGLDSLHAVLRLVADGHSPVLISHRSNPRTGKIQRELATELLGRNMPVHPMRVRVHREGQPPSDSSQRARSFLFLTLAAIVSHEMNLDEIVVGENGIVSLNLHLTEEVVDTLATRSTRPDVLASFQRFIRLATGRALVIENPALLKTKSELVSAIVALGHGDLIDHAASCAHLAGRTTAQPHCGLCSQCVERRFAAVSANAEHVDPPERYAVDIFYDSPGEGIRARVPRAYLQAAYRKQGGTVVDLLAEYPELYELEGALGADFDDAMVALGELEIRHAEQVIDVMAAKTQEGYARLYRGELPEDCLVRLAARLQHTQEPIDELLDVISDILRAGVPMEYQRREAPANEDDLQVTMQACLAAAGQRMDREAPSVPYAVVARRPDFSQRDEDVFIEAKVIRERGRRSRTIDEMNADIVAYMRHARCVLFVVWADHTVVEDRRAFVEDIECPGVRVLMLP